MRTPPAVPRVDQDSPRFAAAFSLPHVQRHLSQRWNTLA